MGRVVAYANAGAGVLTLALTARWSWFRFVYLLVAVLAGIFFLLTGNWLARRTKSAPGSNRTFRIFGLVLIDIGVAVACALTFPYRTPTIAGTAVAGTAFICYLVIVRRRPDLSPFWATS
jgi:uncharacterized protein YjeT (DUF2065 family)